MDAPAISSETSDGFACILGGGLRAMGIRATPPSSDLLKLERVDMSLGPWETSRSLKSACRARPHWALVSGTTRLQRRPLVTLLVCSVAVPENDWSEQEGKRYDPRDGAR